MPGRGFFFLIGPMKVIFPRVRPIGTFLSALQCGTLFWFAMNGHAPAALTINDRFVPVVETFDGFTGAGFAPVPGPGQLDSDHWRVIGLSDGAGTFGGTHTSGDFAQGSSGGSVTTGGVYGFDVDNAAGVNRALGLQPTGVDVNPGTLTLMLLNGTGNAVPFWDISYDIWTYNDQNRGSSFNFASSTDDITYSPVSLLDFTTPVTADATALWVLTRQSVRLSFGPAGIPVDGTLFLQWQTADAGGSGSRDQIALDNVSITAVPEASTTLGLVGLLGTSILWRRRRSSGWSSRPSMVS